MTDVLKNKRKTFLFVFLAIALVLTTWYKLKIQGITMTEDISEEVSYEEVLICENTDINHVHSTECYEKVAVVSSDGQSDKDETNKKTTDNLDESENSEELNDEQEKISEETIEQQEITRNMNSNGVVANNTSSVNSVDTYALGGNNDISTLALDNVTQSTSNNAVNVYVNIDGNWTLIGVLQQTSTNSNSYGGYSSKSISVSSITELFNNKLGIDLSSTTFDLCYFTSTGSTFSKSSVNNSKYNLGSSSSYKNAYITLGVTTASGGWNGGSSDLSRINTYNTFKLYSITEKSPDDVEVQGSPKYVYTTNGTATYTLPTEYDYYVNGSTTQTTGGTTINITGQTTIKRIEVEKCTITIKHVDGTITTEQVRKNFPYTLGSNLKWYVGDSTELTDGGTQITVNGPITITESNQITINYSVDLPTYVSDTYKTSSYYYDSTPSYEGIAIPTVQESDKYSTIITYADGAIIENLSDKYVTPWLTGTPYTTKDRIVLEFAGWKINNGNNTIQAGINLTWSDLYNYAQNGVINLSTIWNEINENYRFVNFYIQYESVAVDTDGNISGHSPNNYTPSLWGSYVGNSSAQSSDLADQTADNSYTVNKKIRELEGEKENSIYIYSIPSDEYILAQLKANYSGNLSVDGESVSINEIDLEHYEIRWYVFKKHNNWWHVDGKLVRKEGKMAITKTFTGSKSAIESVTGYSFEKNTPGNSNYYIELKGGDTTTTTTNLPLSSATLENKTTVQNGVSTYMLKYTWIVDVKYGIKYTITEKNYDVDTYITNTVYNIVDPESTKYKKKYNADGTYIYEVDKDGNFVPSYVNQSKGLTTADHANVIGVNNYAIDSGEDVDINKIIKVNFTNTYAPTSAITIQKEDSVTNNGLANAQFSLYEVNNGNIDTNSPPLKFTYNESIYTYNENGNRTVLTSPTGGSIIINGLPTGKTYKLVEISVPEGYDGNSSVEVTLTVDSKGVMVPVITKGTGKDYDKTNKILEVDNASKLTNVKVTKIWDNVPEEYKKDVIVELYLNNIPISKYNLGYDLNSDGNIDSNDVVQNQVTLNSTNDWEYIWNNLPLYVDGSKAKYSVREIQIGDVKAVTNGSYNSNNGTWESYDAYTQYRAHTTAQTETKDSDGNITQVSFDLINTIHLIKININKISPLGVSIDGVKFRLQKVDDLGNIDTTFTARELVTSLDGKLSFVDLEYDTKYVITEIEGNKGYYLDSTPIYVIINKGEQDQGDTLTLYKKVDAADGTTVLTEAVEGDYEYVSLNDVKDTLNIINISHTPMPKAGGCGVYSFYILGIFLMGCSTIIIYLRKNKIKKGM